MVNGERVQSCRNEWMMVNDVRSELGAGRGRLM